MTPKNSAETHLRDQNAPEILLSVEHLTVHYSQQGASHRTSVLAVDDVSFQVQRGKTLGIVGESGSGKTTTGLALARLIPASSGCVVLNGVDLFTLNRADLRRARARLQFIFQDPYSALNPRFRAEDAVREPLKYLTDLNRPEQDAIIDEMFAAVGLRPEHKRLFPHQFSGGQRQRIGIARALATAPDLIICDEPVSALDVAVQAQILNLLQALQKARNLTCVFISHDLGVVQHMCDDIAVMKNGKIVEFADRKSLFTAPAHPYTESLLNAVPKVCFAK